jgi:hypothetical protein
VEGADQHLAPWAGRGRRRGGLVDTIQHLSCLSCPLVEGRAIKGDGDAGRSRLRHQRRAG